MGGGEDLSMQSHIEAIVNELTILKERGRYTQVTVEVFEDVAPRCSVMPQREVDTLGEALTYEMLLAAVSGQGPSSSFWR